MNIKSEKLDAVKCVIGQSTKKNNTVTMAVANDFIIEAVTLFDLLKAGKKPKTGLIGIKLVAEYADDIDDIEKSIELIEGMNDGLTDAGIDIESGDVEGDDAIVQEYKDDHDEYEGSEK